MGQDEKKEWEGKVFPYAPVGWSPPLFCCPTVRRGRWPMWGYPFEKSRFVFSSFSHSRAGAAEGIVKRGTILAWL
ncbi:MAG TPA: hypothetical protein VJ869_04420, partial [Sphaerochaeta sp.]|nr:hypothetical protein [Sphaerochaeta sp.]